MGKIIKLLVIILAVLVVLGFAKDLIAKGAIEQGVNTVTGIKLNMASLRIGILKTLVDIKGLKLYNPPDFKDKVMMDMPEIYVDYDLPAIFKNKIHLEKMVLNLNEFTVVKNEKGVVNLDSLKVVKSQKTGANPQEEKKAGKAPEFMIDDIRLKVGKIIYKDYTQGATPKITEVNINLDEQYKNINDPYTLVSLVLVRSLVNTSIGKMVNLDVAGLQSSVNKQLLEAQKSVTEAVSKAQTTLTETQKQLENVTKTSGQTVAETQESVKKAAEGLKNIFGGITEEAKK